MPFLIAIALLAGMTRTMPTFHGGDEPIHYATILDCARRPFTDFVRDYAVTNGPFYYLLFAAAGRVIGFDLWKMRLLNVLASYVSLIILFLLFARRLKMDSARALAATVLIGLSPYYLGSSLILLTDNLAWLFLFWALYSWLGYQESGRARSAALGCLGVALACFTRQNAVWVVFPAFVAIVRSRAAARSRVLSCIGLGLSLAPLALLVAIWGGLVPPSSKRVFLSAGWFNPRVPLFILALLGLYALFIAPWPVIRDMLRRRNTLYWSTAVAGVSLVANATHPLHRVMTALNQSDGYLWRLSTVGGRGDVSIVMWALIPAGAVVTTWLALTSTGAGALLWVGTLVSFTLVSSTSAQVFQKYYDVFVLLLLFGLAYGPSRTASGRVSWVDGSRLVLLGLAFAAYPVARIALGF